MRIYNLIGSFEFNGLYVKDIDVNTIITACCAKHKVTPSLQDDAILRAVHYLSRDNKNAMINLATPQYGQFVAIRLALACGIAKLATGLSDEQVIECAYDITNDFVDTKINKEVK